MDKTIRTCFELSPDFGVDVATVKSETEGAFTDWQSYIERKFKFADIKLGLTTQVAVNPVCQGNEDLVFYFGTQNEEIRLAKSLYNNPSAFGFKRFYNHERRWGQGWIWFAPPSSVFPKDGFPDWSPKEPVMMPEGKKQPWALRVMLMHEIGHVLGNPHVAGTIMTERISEYIHAGYAFGSARIDQARELSICWQCGYEWDGSLTIYGQTVDLEDPMPSGDAAYKKVARDNFEILTGHAPKSDGLGAKIRSDASGTVFEVFDKDEIYSFPIEFPQDSLSAINDTRVEDPTPIFKRALGGSGVLPGSYLSARVQGVVEYGTLKTARGESLTVIVERNLPVPESRYGIFQEMPLFARADFRLKMIRQGQIRPLFEASWLAMLSSIGHVTPIVGPSPLPAPSPSSR
ncbi:hypothetical protein WDW86_01955 [Bdellovibrionota bacterium FG-2]